MDEQEGGQQSPAPAELPHFLQRKTQPVRTSEAQGQARSGSGTLGPSRCPQFPALAIVLGIIIDHRLVRVGWTDGRRKKSARPAPDVGRCRADVLVQLNPHE